jgi:hypothetical protein
MAVGVLTNEGKFTRGRMRASARLSARSRSAEVH